MNKVIEMGRATDKPKYSENGDTKVARFTLAVDRYKEGADFISIVAFNKSAEFCDKYVNKGTKLLVEGRIQTGSYTNKDGAKVYTTDVIAEHLEFCESKKSQEESTPAPAPTTDADGFMSIPDTLEEELPFV